MTEQKNEYAELDHFLKGQRVADIPRSRWIKAGPISVYLRAGKYHVHQSQDTFSYAIGVANVHIAKRARLGKGHFKRLMVHLEKRASALAYDAIRVEEVHNPALLLSLLQHGYTQLPGSSDTSPIMVKCADVADDCKKSPDKAV